MLRAEPFEMPWGSSISAQVYSSNVLGNSVYSDIGNGAVILSIPSAPYDLENDIAYTTASTIGFKWTAPDETGGTAVIDYRVYYDQGDALTSDFVVLESNIVDLEYIATSMSMGVTYRFKVAARNLVGYSAQSDSISILAA